MAEYLKLKEKLKQRNREILREWAVIAVVVMLVIAFAYCRSSSDFTNAARADLVIGLAEDEVEVEREHRCVTDGVYDVCTATVDGSAFGERRTQHITRSSYSAALKDDRTYLVIKGRNTYLFLSDKKALAGGVK